jgi:hypothetical protein
MENVFWPISIGQILECRISVHRRSGQTCGRVIRGASRSGYAAGGVVRIDVNLHAWIEKLYVQQRVVLDKNSRAIFS